MSIRIDGTNTTANPGITGSDTDTGLQFGTNEVKVVTDGTTRATVDSSGRVGIATTPEAWSGFDALEVNEASIVSSGSGDAFFTANAYYDGAWKYKDGGVARNIYMNADGIVFRQAASGSADASISWSESMRIDTSGRLQIGTTAGTGNLNVAGTGDAAIDLIADSDDNGSNQWPIINFRRHSATGTPVARIYQVESDGSLRFDNGGSERLRILTGGGLTFNGDSATANALDDYEEGTWTCGVETGTVTSEDARYTRIGNLVHAHVKLTSFSDRSSSANVIINGLPFSTSINQASGSMFGRYLDRTAFTVYTFTTKSEFYSIGSGNFVALLHNQLNNSNAVLYFQATYLIN
jgi:hypothetical protein